MFPKEGSLWPFQNQLKSSVASRIKAPKDAYILIPGTLPGKRDIAGVIKAKDLEMRRLSWIIQMTPNVIKRVLKSKEPFPDAENHRDGSMEKDSACLCCLSRLRKSHKPMNRTASRSWKSQRMDSLLSPPEWTQPCEPFDLSLNKRRNCVGLVTYRTTR